MDQNELRALLQGVADGNISADDAFLEVKSNPFADLEYAKPDFHRKVRRGISEVIYGEGKTAGQIAGILRSFAVQGQKNILITRLDKTKAEKILKNSGFRQFRVRVHGELARIELLPEDFEKLFKVREKLYSDIKALGFSYVTMDLQGYRMGSMNEGIAEVRT